MVYPGYSRISTTTSASWFAGNVINLFLYGALTVQFYLYHTSFPQDPRPLKTTVYLIYAIATVYTILLTYNLGAVILGSSSDHTISLIVVPVGGGLVAFLTQAAYAYRLRVLSKLKCVSWCIVALIGADLVLIIVLAPIMLSSLPLFADPSHTPGSSYFTGYRVILLVFSSVSLATDITIAGIMIWLLTRNKILSKQLRSKMTRLVNVIISTGTLTAVINLVTLILFALNPPAAWGPAIVLSMLYANSMMILLNNRILSGHRGCGGQALSPETVTELFGSLHFTTTSGPAESVQEQLAFEGCNNAGNIMSGRTTVEDPSQKHSCPA